MKERLSEIYSGILGKQRLQTSQAIDWGLRMPSTIFWTSYTFFSFLFFFSEQRFSKGEHTYGWSSASGGNARLSRIG
jgi:hypothetical protein